MSKQWYEQDCGKCGKHLDQRQVEVKQYMYRVIPCDGCECPCHKGRPVRCNCGTRVLGECCAGPETLRVIAYARRLPAGLHRVVLETNADGHRVQVQVRSATSTEVRP